MSEHQAPPTSNDADDDANPPVYYAVRRGRFVRGCIFVSWDDARLHVNDYPTAEYSEFEDFADAVKYVKTGASSADDDAERDDTAASSATAGGTPVNGPSAAGATAASSSSARGRRGASSSGSSSAKKKKRSSSSAATPSSSKKRKTTASTTPKAKGRASKAKASKTPASKGRGPDKQKRKPYKQWEQNYDALKELKEKTGALDVDGDDGIGEDHKKKLGRWIADQRAVYKAYVEGKDSAMTADKVKRLEDIGFDFRYKPASSGGEGGGGKGEGGGAGGGPASDRKRKPYKQWEDMFTRLGEHKAETGTCDVNKKDKDKQKQDLRLWCNEQRLQYKNMQSGKPTSMSEEKIGRLTELGFDFSYFTWEDRMEQLRRFKEETGHFNVPREHPSLGKWARKVRVQYRKLADSGRTSAPADGKARETLTREQFDELTRMGFKPTSRKLILDDDEEQEKWDRGFAELARYKEEHGDCLVSTTPPHTDLTRFVLAQRREYQRLKDGKESFLTAARLAKLNDVGFVFRQKKNYMSWRDRIEQLRQYKEVHGHIRIPVSDPNLGSFVTGQREEYRNRMAGLPSRLTDEKMQQLTDLGFVFVAGKRTGSRTAPPKTWEERFESLLEFKEEYGHTVVPQHYPGLGHWVHSQRKNFKKLKQGKPSPLTAERALKLADVGFVFDAMKKKGAPAGGNVSSDEE